MFFTNSAKCTSYPPALQESTLSCCAKMKEVETDSAEEKSVNFDERKGKDMKQKKRLGITIAVALCVLILCACGSGKNSIVGHWQLSSNTSNSPFRYLYFYSDGTYSSGGSNYKGTYSVDGKNIRLEGFLVDDVNATFEISGNELTLKYWARTETYTRSDE